VILGKNESRVLGHNDSMGESHKTQAGIMGCGN